MDQASHLGDSGQTETVLPRNHVLGSSDMVVMQMCNHGIVKVFLIRQL